MTKIIRMLAATAAAGLLLAGGQATATAAPAVTAGRAETPAGAARLELPRPTGAFAVGRDTLHIVDTARKDPWVPTADRELLVSLYYPAVRGSGHPAPYTTVDEARALLADRGELGRYATAEQVAAVRTHAREGALPRVGGGRYPLVVLSPGFTLPRSSLTALAEDLTSRGYVVAALDHAYESDGTVFPGGRLLGCKACEQVFPDRSLHRVSEARARDVTFLLDRLTGDRPAWRHSRLIDTRRIGMAGHSIGGASAAAAMAADPRVAAGVNMDGTFFAPLPESGLGGRPFLLLGGDPALTPPEVEDTSWADAWPRMDGWKRWLTVTGMGHPGFTDWPVLADAAGAPHPETPLSGDRSQRITRAYTGDFFDRHLKGLPAPRLDGPTAADPEVVFQRS
ncbi:alpha/beta hydrolase family protein [Streptomyces lavendulae]|uniref:alpha/beta hydrolase family protein n=1 Tax=Streptomyces lavendulae TaxID=1914 RepID=UPI0024A22DCB|nr:alpha/beta hydrolase [Streptomyces lavendulae]GLX21453.1 lipase [Streptomyces lavendulae subsp. lavendulae]GLX28870.1 lipase [Streptomyces lavendulae subsp. lavendulae]